MESSTATEIAALIYNKGADILDVMSLSYKDRVIALDVYGRACSERTRRLLIDDWHPLLLPDLMPFEFDDDVVTLCAGLAEYMRAYLINIGVTAHLTSIVSEVKGVLLSICGESRSTWDIAQRLQLKRSIRLLMTSNEEGVQCMAHEAATRMLLNQIDTIFCFPVNTSFMEPSSK